jgi:hypothetical protein
MGDNPVDEKANAVKLPEPEQNASEALGEEQLNGVVGGSGSGSTDPSYGIKLNHNQNLV